MCLHLKIKSFGCAAPDKTTLHWDSTFYFNAFYNWFCLSIPSVRQPHRSKDWKTSTELLSFAQISTGEIPTPGPCRSVPPCCWDKVSSQVSVTNHCFSWRELSYSSTIHHEHLHLWSDSTGKKKKKRGYCSTVQGPIPISWACLTYQCPKPSPRLLGKA